MCKRLQFDPDKYDLKLNNRLLDLHTSFRLSGLRNNAEIQLVERKKKRQDSEVEILIQLSDGTRFSGKFQSNVKLLEIIQQLCPDELTDNLWALYMRTEIESDKLALTSLKDLGLTSGRAILKLVHRDANEETKYIFLAFSSLQ